MTERFDVVIVGGGHNGLTAAAYLAQAGKSVLVLERLAEVGGAAVSTQAFTGLDARLSRYSYLVSLLPKRVIRDLGLDIRLRRRRFSSYTPRVTASGAPGGILIDRSNPTATAEALGADARNWTAFSNATGVLARGLFPTVTEPLLRRSEARAAVGHDGIWDGLVERPVGEAIAATFTDDVVRGIVLTDALIGTFAPNVDESLAANKCFLYHVIGNGTGDWDVPVGGMGAVTGALLNAARTGGAVIRTAAEVTAVTPDGEVSYRSGDADVRVAAGVVLANVAPSELERLLAQAASTDATPAALTSVLTSALSATPAKRHPRVHWEAGPSGQPTSDAVTPAAASQRPEGSQVKVNLLVRRLPKLRDPQVESAAAFGGTFHINESWNQLQVAYDAAQAGTIPSPLPCEIYSHSLTDPSILSPELQASGAQTLTVFGLHVPSRLVDETNNDRRREELEAAAIDSVNSVLAEPIEELLLNDDAGRHTIETKTTLDLEHALRMPGGNIFHGPLDWPFVEDDAPLETAAQRWGVATRHPRILLCGAGARRGGGVSGLGGHNAAMAVLESD